jgi:hypothetical protein
MEARGPAGPADISTRPDVVKEEIINGKRADETI